MKDSPCASHVLWVSMKTGLAVQDAFLVPNTTEQTPLELSQGKNALVSYFKISIVCAYNAARLVNCLAI